MQESIKQGGVDHITTQHTDVEGAHLITTFIHHALTTGQVHELAQLVEAAILDAVKTYVGA